VSARDLATFARARLAARRQPATNDRFCLPDLHSLRASDPLTQVGVLVYQGVTTTEIAEPVARLAQGLQADVVHIGVSVGAVVGVEPVRTVHIDHDLHDPGTPVPPVLVIPGGLGWKRLVDDLAVLTWIASVAGQADGVLTMSTGSLILASAGRLSGQAATGHWLAQDTLSALGADVRRERTTRSKDSRVVTASGASAALGASGVLADRLRWGPS